MSDKSSDGAGDERQATAAGAAAAAARGTRAAGVVSQQQLLRPLPRHSLYNTKPSSSPTPASKGGSESESDIHEKMQRDQQDQDQDQDQGQDQPASDEVSTGAVPPAAVDQSEAATTEEEEQIVIHLQLIPCSACAASASLAHCLTARDRNGDQHTPRLRVVWGKAFRKRSKALLLPGEREPAVGAEDGSMEDLPLTPENMSLRFRVPCDLCTTLAMCANKHHSENVRTLADMVRVPPGTGGVEYTGSHHGAVAHRSVGSVKEETRELGGEGGERDGRAVGVAAEAAAAVAAAAAAAGTPRTIRSRARARRRVLEVEGKRVMMPNMISVCDGVVLSLYLAPISIFSERREDVPGDLEIDESMGNMSRGGYHFARMPSVTIANVLKLRALRDVISWKHNEAKTVHRIVAAKVLSVWERHHPGEAKQLDELLRDGDVDKDLIFQVGNAGPTAVYKVSELRMVYARRATEAPLLIAGFTEEQLNASTAEGGEQFYADDLEEADGEEVSDAEEGEEEAAADAAAEGMGRGKRALSSSSDAAAGRGDYSIPTGKRAYRRRTVVGGSPPPLPPPTPARSSSASPRPRRRRRSRVKEVVASDGKCYTLPLCVREKGKKLNLYVSLRAHKVDGDSLFTDPSAENAPLQRPYGRADITRENLLALRAVRDLVYRSPTVHPIIAADAFEIWENVHAAETPRPDDDTVVISGARTAGGNFVPQEKFTVGELRRLRGVERRKAVDDLLDGMLRSPSVMAGELVEATPTPAAAVAAVASADARAEELYGGGGRGRGGGSSSSLSGSKKMKKMKISRQKLIGGGGAGVAAAAAVPAHEIPATAVSSCSYSSSSSVSSSPGVGSGRAATRASKRKKPSRLEDEDEEEEDEEEEEEEEEEEAGGTSGATGRPAGGGGAAAVVGRGSKRRSLGRVEEEGWGAATDSGVADPYPFYRQGKKPAEAKDRRKGDWRIDGGDEEDDDRDDNSEPEEEEEEAEEEEVATAGGEQQRRQGGGGGGGGGGGSPDSLAGVRRDSWLQAVHENDRHLKLELERLRKEKARVKEAHLARNVELMKWMVQEQSGMHGGSAGPPPRR